ncbi:SpoIVB peptidase S55 domain-containing protein [Romboutsia sp.]|uniref:SpoIVB peptidase S55 domain-containing protein n=1 Tax=Romboutsia sp. TaxID=1965302 RepID=UPI003F2E7A13
MNHKVTKNNLKKIVLLSLIIGFVGITICNIQANNNFSSEKNNITSQTKYVYPLGNVIGIKANTDGVLVVGYEDDVEYIGGIKVGDNITKINNQEIKSIDDVSKILNKVTADKAKVTFEREGKYKTENITIKGDGESKKLGLWVRNKISGIGTITFYDPKTCQFNAIGHAITDVDTNKLLKIKKGYIYHPEKFKIIKGNKNNAGKIEGEFNNNRAIGEFLNNSNFGISGKMLGEKKIDVQLIEVGNRKDVKLGKAYILFEDKNRNITSYEAKIKNIATEEKTTKNFTIEVTDKELIEYTGGIVQGMSGAPIVQNNKIIGAITHVFKDDYKKGYGIFIDEMIELDKTY